ncbi:protein O-mannosyl-transferase TMTC4 isoform X2 [Manduca sexta]|uniref:protein O-mannosyl-transferase TMTC4 isoform X2 n=1 Tax=Manduca sexta TaxID=7130 RepID=UPI00188E93C9|nr:protein O-mannosyl-transferase TMTC4 isoform X2 [Manduca sexta]
MYKPMSIVLISSLPYLVSLDGDFVFDDSEAIVKNKDVISESWFDPFYNDFWGMNIKSNLSHKSYRPLTILTFRWTVMGGTKPVFKAIDNPAAFAENFFTRIRTYNYIYFLNGVLFLWPQWLCYDWSMGCIPLVENVLDNRNSCILMLYIYVLLIICNIIFRNSGPKKRLIMLAVCLIIVPFSPASNIFYSVGFVIAERILYIPSAGYCLLVGIGFNTLLNYRSQLICKVAKFMFLLLLLIYETRSWQRSLDWQNEYSLFISGLSVCPLNAKVHYNVAKVADASHHTEWALAEYKEAIRLFPEYYQAMNNLANLLKNEKKYQEAEFYLTAAIKHKPDFPAAWMNLGIVLANTKRYNESEIAYKTALTYRKKYPDCLYNLGNLYLEMNNTFLAMEKWFDAINLNSKHDLAWTNLMALLDNTGQINKALKIIPKALAELPESPSVNFAIANIYGKINEYEEAEKYFKKSIKLFNSKVQAIHYANLGVLYHRWKKYSLAEEMYLNALKIDPFFKSAQRNLHSLRKFKNK